MHYGVHYGCQRLTTAYRKMRFDGLGVGLGRFGDDFLIIKICKFSNISYCSVEYGVLVVNGMKR